MTLAIAKLGGSLARSREREPWLAALASARGRLIIVPGGGPFADAVRCAQEAIGFDDAAAHRMALLAMEQFAVILAAHSDAYSLAASRAEIESALAAGKIPIWLPTAMALGASDLPASWDVTSDSLAAWLAETTGARDLLLIKSCDAAAPVSVEDLAAGKLVDPLFPSFAAKSGAMIWIAGPASLAGAAEILNRGGMPGAGVSLN